MIDLLGDDEIKFHKAVDDVIALRPDFVRIYPTLVIRGTRLFDLYNQQSYFPWSLERTIKALKKEVKKFRNHCIPVIRLGLHSDRSMLGNICILKEKFILREVCFQPEERLNKVEVIA